MLQELNYESHSRGRRRRRADQVLATLIELSNYLTFAIELKVSTLNFAVTSSSVFVNSEIVGSEIIMNNRK